MENWPVISVILNVVLVVLLFFQGTVNDFFSHNRERRRSEQERERENLKKLRKFLNEYNQYFFHTAPLCLVLQTRTTVEQFKEIDLVYKPIKEKFDLAQNELNNLKPDLTKELRERLDAILLDAGKILVFAVGGQQFVHGMENLKMTQDQFVNEMVSVGRECGNFIADIEKMINK